MESTKILTGKDVLLIKATKTVRNYKETASEGYRGKKYRVYAYADKGFAVHEDDETKFATALEEGEIAEVQFVVTDDGWSLSNWLTWKQINNLKRRQVENEAITVEAFRPQSVRAYEELA
jgi:hypothetical protein